MISYVYLFFISFGAATLLPIGSEVYVLYLLVEGLDFLLLLVVATLGNTIGSFVNYLLGFYLFGWALKKGYFSKKSVTYSRKIFDKYGIFALLLSWVPIIGDPITFVAGALRYDTKIFLMVVVMIKMLRYLFVLYMYEIL